MDPLKQNLNYDHFFALKTDSTYLFNCKMIGNHCYCCDEHGFCKAMESTFNIAKD